MTHDAPTLQHDSEPAESVAPLARTPERARDRVPDWAPWAVLGTLVGLGMLGGLGLLPFGSLGWNASSAATSSAAAPELPPESSDAKASAPAPPPSGSAARGPFITASHIVVSHAGSKLGARQGLTRSREEAKLRAEEVLARLRKGDDFVKLVAEYSDEPGAAAKKGYIGKFAERHALPGFGAAAVKLAPGEYSDVVETGLGFHVIQRNQ